MDMSMYYTIREYSGLLELEGVGKVYINYLRSARGFISNKYGYMDENLKKLQIPLKYDNEFGFIDNIAIVKLDNKWGAIDEKDNIIIPIKYESVFGLFKEKYYLLKNNGKCGIFHLEKKLIVPFKYDYIDDFIYTIGVGINGKYGFIDYELREVTPLIFNYMKGYMHPSNDVICVGIKDKYGFTNKNGKIIIPIIYNDVKVMEGNIEARHNGKSVFYKRDKWDDEVWNIETS